MSEKISRLQSTQNSLVDLFERSISYLRLSITDRCNLTCLYCVPEESDDGPCKLSHGELLSFEELLRVVHVAVDMGISKVRLTGGEPLIRRNVLSFIGELGRIKGLNDIRLTTNGVLLDRYAQALVDGGVTKVNISLDTLRRQRFEKITGYDLFDQVWRGIERSLHAGFALVKLNVVVMRGINDDEVLHFAELSRKRPLQVRFIEFMPIGDFSRWNKEIYVSTDELLERLSRHGELVPAPRGKADGPARIYRFGQNPTGNLGFISPLSHKFCDRCNRLRLTSEGRLRSCLLHDAEVDLRKVLRSGGGTSEIREALLTAIRNKPQEHGLMKLQEIDGGSCHGRMSRIGG
ncbi:MAG: GTP 3',8-cyclase MoaA [Desulfobulbus propionicus]|nr:MAG: GTP 3',8-cyclase MoaA [Desulfobulbus propionicus]